MELLLQRKSATSGAIFGELSVNGAFECYTAEREGEEIALGRYPVTITPSNHFHGKVLPLIERVPGRSGLRIHSGNDPRIDSEGCVLVGQVLGEGEVLRSRLALEVLQPKIAGAVARHEDVWLTIRAAQILEMTA